MRGTMFPFMCLRCVCAEVFEVFWEHKLAINERH